jgi:hypothetical protein
MEPSNVTETMGSGIQMYVFSHETSIITTNLGLTRRTERHNNQMDHSRHPLRRLHGLVRRRLHPREATIKEGLTIARIPSRTLLLRIYFAFASKTVH